MIEIKSSNASLTGVAGRVSAAEKAEMQAKALPAILRATIHVTRASTGKVDTYEIVGTTDAPPQPAAKE
jgi:hypothetical protein